jgi:putative transposase
VSDAQPRPSHFTPHSSEGFARTIDETHRQYTACVNARVRCAGHLFLGRFASVVRDEAHREAPRALSRLRRYAPAGWRNAQHWPWSSVRAHLDGRGDEFVRVTPLLDRVGRFTDLIVPGAEPEAFAALGPAEGTRREKKIN